MKEYKPVPVQAAKDIAILCDKQIVVIIAHDTVHNQVHTTTYGVSAEDKIEALKLAERLQAHAGSVAGEERTYGEDFRKDFDAAKYKAACEALQKIAKYDEESIWDDDRDDAASNMLDIAREALK